MKINYTTENLAVTPISIQGQVMKRIEDSSIWHRSDFHTRFFKVEFGRPFCYFYQKESDNEWHKSHKQSDIRSCAVLTEEEIIERFE